MRSVCSLAPLAALPLAAWALAVPGEVPGAPQPAVVRLALTESEGAVSPDARRAKREASRAPLVASRGDVVHMVSVGIGNPPQKTSLVFDLGSSLTWAKSNCVRPETHPVMSQADCEALGVFDPSKSTTFVDANVTMTQRYLGQAVNLTMGHDALSFGSLKLDKQYLGVATDNKDFVPGVLGGTMGQNDGETSDVIRQLGEKKMTKRHIVGLDVRGSDSDRGSLIFGGVDTSKFYGRLERRQLMMIGDFGDFKDLKLWLRGDGMRVDKGNGAFITPATAEQGFVALPDSGSSLTYLPDEMFQSILPAFPSAKPLDGNPAYYTIDCAVASHSGSIDFVFGSTTIRMPYRDCVLPAQDGVCTLALSTSRKPLQAAVHLGANFLKNVYFVVDWEDTGTMYLANSHDCGETVVELDGSADVGAIVGKCEAPAKPCVPKAARGGGRA